MDARELGHDPLMYPNHRTYATVLLSIANFAQVFFSEAVSLSSTHNHVQPRIGTTKT